MITEEKPYAKKKTPGFPGQFCLVETVVGRRGHFSVETEKIFPSRIRDFGICSKGCPYFHPIFFAGASGAGFFPLTWGEELRPGQNGFFSRNGPVF